MTGLVIRPVGPADRPALRTAIVDLQEHERALSDTRRPGEEMADDYLAWLVQACQDREGGFVLLAEENGCYLGYVAGWIEDESWIPETPDSTRFGRIGDIHVAPERRGRRIAQALLDATEEHFRRHGIGRVRINALAANAQALAAYRRAGYMSYEVDSEKRL